MSSTRVAIIGASSAGLVAAYNLARKDIPVQVFEAQNKFEPPERTLIVTPAIKDLLDFDFSEAVVNRITGFLLIAANKSAKVPVLEPDFVIERNIFLRLLYKKVEECGAKISLGHRIRKVESRIDSVEITVDNEGKEIKIIADYAIIANGVKGISFLPCYFHPIYRTVGISQARVDLPGHMDKSTVHVWFDPSTTRFFYWLIPENERSGVLGVIGETKEEARNLLTTFVKKMGIRVEKWQDEEDVPLPGLRLNGISVKNGRIFFAGDSAAQVKATTVGGLITGIKGGISAAESIMRGGLPSKFLKSLERELFFHSVARRLLNMFNDSDYERLIKLLNRRLLSLLNTTTRDDLRRMSLKLFIFQPRLLELLCRVLFRKIFSHGSSRRDSTAG